MKDFGQLNNFIRADLHIHTIESKYKDKKIVDENKIQILINGEVTTTIENENKSEVSGETIYNSLKYSSNDKYELEPFDVKEDIAKKNYKAAEMIYMDYTEK